MPLFNYRRCLMIYLVVIDDEYYLTKNSNKIDELSEKYDGVNIIEIQEEELLKDVWRLL